MTVRTWVLHNTLGYVFSSGFLYLSKFLFQGALIVREALYSNDNDKYISKNVIGMMRNARGSVMLYGDNICF